MAEDETRSSGPKKSKLERAWDKVAELRARRETAVAKVAEREAELAGARTDRQREIAQERLDRAREQAEELRKKLRLAEIDVRYEEAQDSLRQARAAVEAVEDEALADPETREQFERVIIARIEELINARATTNRIQGRIEELADRVRAFVLAHPTGWVAGVEDSERKYLCYLSPDGRFQVVLEDNPLYELTVDQLVGLTGLEAATPFLAVDYTAVHKAVEGKQLRAKQVRDGETEPRVLMVDDLRALRTRTERTKKVKATYRGTERVEEIVEVVAPELLPEFVEKLEALGLDKATVDALHAAGITRVGQVRLLSGDDLAKIKGIGPARAGKIIAAVVKRAAV